MEVGRRAMVVGGREDGDVMNLADILRGHFAKLRLGEAEPPTEVAKHFVGGAVRKAFKDRIRPVLETLREGRVPYHIIISGRRGSGKTHLCYRIMGEAERLGIPYRLVTPRRDLSEIVENGLEGIVEKLKPPSILIIDDIDEYLMEEAAVTKIRERLAEGITNLVERSTVMLILSTLSHDLLKKLLPPSTWSKMVGERGVSGPPGYYGRRCEIIEMEEYWDRLTKEERVDTLNDIIYGYIKYYVENTPELRGYAGKIDKGDVRNLFSDDLWDYLSRFNDVGAALRIAKRVLVKLDEGGRSMLTLGDVGDRVARVYEILSRNIPSLKTWKDRLRRVAFNMAELLVALGYAVSYAPDIVIPRGVRKGWVKVDVSLIMRDGSQTPILVPTLEKELYMRGRDTMEKIVKLLGFNNVGRVVLLAPVDAEKSIRRFIGGYETLSKAYAERKLITALVDMGKLYLLLSDLTLEEAKEWRRIPEIVEMLKEELGYVKDISGVPLTEIFR
jgi:hypothetical protein